MRRPKIKTATLTLRLDPKIKAAAEAAAEKDHRSLTSLLEVLIVNHCRALGLGPEQLNCIVFLTIFLLSKCWFDKVSFALYFVMCSEQYFVVAPATRSCALSNTVLLLLPHDLVL